MYMRYIFKTLNVIALLAVSFSLAAQPKLTKDNIDEVVKAMSLEEKAALLVGANRGSSLGGITTSVTTLVPGAAGMTLGLPKYGITQTVLADGPAGLRISPTRQGDEATYYCTGFPVGTAIACSWNTELAYNVGKAIGNEVLEYGTDVILGPGMNLHRNPLNGRNFEYYSEDPLVTGKIGAAFINGIQSNGVGTSAKHFAVNNQETNRSANNAVVSQRALRELYLKGFEIAVKEAQPWTIMSSYNKLNGEFAQQSYGLLTSILRDEWGFKGIVMTDWGAKEGTVLAAKAGNDLMEPGQPVEIQRLIDAVKSGELSEDIINNNVKRMLEYIVKTPRFNGYKYSNKPDMVAHAAVTRQSATEGMVLLKNDSNTLPMEGVKSIDLYGVTSYDFIAGGTGSGNVNKPYVINLLDGLSSAGYQINPDIQNYYEAYINWQNTSDGYEGRGGGILLGKSALPEMPVGRNFINNNATKGDIAVVTIGRQAGEAADRKVDNDFNLTAVERQLLNDICDAYHLQGKKVVVILNIGGVIETASWKNLPDAILCVWGPGQEGGYSIADVLSGKANPSGKLSMTFPVSYLDHPSSHNFPFDYSGGADWGNYGSSNRQRNLRKNIDYTLYNEDIWVGYRYFNTVGKEVSYPFGYGLSYTTFEYGKPTVKAAKDGSVTISVNVKNTGSVAGKEIVQVYIAAPEGGLIKPENELKAFAKTSELAPGQSQTLTMTIDAYTLASFNEESSAWETAAGTYNVLIGASSRDIRCTGSFKLAKPQSWPTHNVLAPDMELEKLVVK